MGIAKLLLPVLVALMASGCCITAEAKVHKHVFVIRPKTVKRQCKNHTIITVNGRFPGPTVEIRNGDSLDVLVKNHAKHNATIHWHGVRQMRTCWSDGPEYITQCPIKPGGSYRYRFTVNGQEGTLWWHAHSSWLRATVYGALIVRPALGTTYPSSFWPMPTAETPILLGEWWNRDPIRVVNAALRTGASPNVSDAFTVNGLLGDRYKRCPNAADDDGIFTLTVKPGSTQLLRLVNAAINTYLFFAVAGHSLTVVAADASYTKPHTTSVLMLGPGQTNDVLLTANRSLCGGGRGRFYMAARAYSPGVGVPFDNTTTTAILHYSNSNSNSKTASTAPAMPRLPAFNDTKTANGFTFSLRSLASPEHPVFVPTGKMDESLFFTVGLGLIPCAANGSCGGPNNTRFAASMNNESFVLPKRTSILQAARFNVKGVFRASFPDAPAVKFDYTANNISRALWAPRKGTRVKVVRYNATVQIVLQATTIFASESHPLHLHGYDFYVVAMGNGNFNPNTDTANFNVLDPPMRNTVTVPVKGWAAIRFVADNPGAWLMHCHLDGHLGWGLATVFVVPDGAGSPLFRLQAPPRDLPAC